MTSFRGPPRPPLSLSPSLSPSLSLPSLSLSVRGRKESSESLWLPPVFGPPGRWARDSLSKLSRDFESATSRGQCHRRERHACRRTGPFPWTPCSSGEDENDFRALQWSRSQRSDSSPRLDTADARIFKNGNKESPSLSLSVSKLRLVCLAVIPSLSPPSLFLSALSASPRSRHRRRLELNPILTPKSLLITFL